MSVVFATSPVLIHHPVEDGGLGGCWLCLWLVVDRIDHISTSSPGCGCCGDGGWCLVVCLLWLLVIVATSPVLLQGVVVVEVEDGGGSSR